MGRRLVTVRRDCDLAGHVEGFPSLDALALKPADRDGGERERHRHPAHGRGFSDRLSLRRQQTQRVEPELHDRPDHAERLDSGMARLGIGGLC